MRRPKNLYNLTRPKLRASWNKFNLFNIARGAGREPTVRGTPTFFQQKWAAKAKTRAYHGEHIAEKKWKRLFSHRLQAAVDMPPEYLAANDGSEQATGRGQGLAGSQINALSYSKVPGVSSTDKKLRVTRLGPAFGDPNALLARTHPDMTPHMQMVFAPLERRLDTAVFRALFASSVRQARQFIVHGAVMVNGKKMVHPAYQLNPGDMFQVEVEKVLFATGAPKKSKEDARLQANLEAQKKRAEVAKQKAIEAAAKSKTADGEAAAEGSENTEAGSEVLSPEEVWRLNNKNIKLLLKEVKRILQKDTKELTATEKKQLRLFRTNAKRFLSHPEHSSLDAETLVEGLSEQMQNHESMRETFEKFTFMEKAKVEANAGEEATEKKDKSALNRSRQIAKGLADLTEKQKEKAIRIMGDTQLSRDEMRKLSQLLRNDEENPFDESKPYATPWRPRPFLAPFAFIPRYLEVNPNICAAIYLRHPVARKGMAEVPTPFSYLTNQLTHNWYTERG
ncbi:37S ribosomal protein NAM9 [Paramyrothecium foliicola]|nr:37S ribosomal protein NAM9 [Paramyrothecium foliicola]